MEHRRDWPNKLPVFPTPAHREGVEGRPRSHLLVLGTWRISLHTRPELAPQLDGLQNQPLVYPKLFPSVGTLTATQICNVRRTARMKPLILVSNFSHQDSRQQFNGNLPLLCCRPGSLDSVQLTFLLHPHCAWQRTPQEFPDLWGTCNRELESHQQPPLSFLDPVRSHITMDNLPFRTQK